MNITVWNEFVHENENENVKKVYPKGIHGQIAEFLKKNSEINVRTATLNEPEHGLSNEVIENTDVLIWWGHTAHDKVDDEIVRKIHNRVLRGMGLIVLHSAHYAKIFKSLMGTTCNLLWRENDRERIWTIEPNHPIAKDIPPYFELEQEEMYGERFDIPKPDETIFLGWFKGGEVFRSGCTFNRGLGKIFYFQPGHEEYPVYYNKYVQQIIINAVNWAKPNYIANELNCPNSPSLEG